MGKFKVKYLASSRVTSMYIAPRDYAPAAYDRTHRSANSQSVIAEKETTRKHIGSVRSKLVLACQFGPHIESFRWIRDSLGTRGERTDRQRSYCRYSYIVCLGFVYCSGLLSSMSVAEIVPTASL